MKGTFSLKKLLIPAIIITLALFCTSCPKLTHYVPPVPLIDLTMESNTPIDSYLSSTAVTPNDGYSGGTGMSLFVSTDQAKTGSQSLKAICTFPAGTYKGCITQVTLGSITGQPGPYNLKSSTISVDIYIPSVPMGHVLPEFVVFILWYHDTKENKDYQLHSAGQPIPLFGGWVTYTMNVWEYKGAGGSSNWWYTEPADLTKALESIATIGVKTQKQQLGNTETFIYYIDNLVLFQY